MLLPLLAVLAVDVATYGVWTPSKDCKELGTNAAVKYEYTQQPHVDEYSSSSARYREGTKVQISCKKPTQELVGSDTATCRNGRWFPEIGSCVNKRCSLRKLKEQGHYYSVTGGLRHGDDSVQHGEQVTAHNEVGKDEFICCLGFWLPNDKCLDIMTKDAN